MSAAKHDPVIEAALINAAAQIVASHAASAASHGGDRSKLYNHDTAASEIVSMLERLRIAYNQKKH